MGLTSTALVETIQALRTRASQATTGFGGPTLVFFLLSLFSLLSLLQVQLVESFVACCSDTDADCYSVGPLIMSNIPHYTLVLTYPLAPLFYTLSPRDSKTAP